MVTSCKIHEAMRIVLHSFEFLGQAGCLVRFEDARLRRWFGKMDAEQAKYGAAVREGAGSIKRDCTIWEDFLTDKGIPFEKTAPKNNKTKLKADIFARITGWTGLTNEHGRDSAMLVFGS